MRVREYVLKNGKSPYQDWFDELDASAAAKVAVLAKDGEDLIILFGGGTKKSQAADIANAKKLHKEYKEYKERKTQPADEKKEEGIKHGIDT